MWDGGTWQSIVPPAIVSYATDTAILTDTVSPAGTYAFSRKTGNFFVRYTEGPGLGNIWKQVGVRTYPTQAGLKADTPGDGSIGFAQDTGIIWNRLNGAWQTSSFWRTTEALILAAPSTQAGEVAVSTDTHKIYVSDGTNWISQFFKEYATEVGLLAATPLDGELAVSLDTGKVAYRAAGNWVMINSSSAASVSSGAGTSTATGALHLNTTTNRLEVYNGTGWVSTAAPVSSLAMIGDVKQSWLTTTEFAAQLPAGEAGTWVLADGRASTGTRFAAITGLTKLPDLRGAYLRPAGQNVNGFSDWNGGTHRGYQNSLTKKPDHPYTGVTSMAPKHFHVSTAVAPADLSASWAVKDGTAMVGYTGGGGHYAQYRSGDGGDHTHTVAINAGGDGETRPNSFSINTFIKVD